MSFDPLLGLTRSACIPLTIRKKIGRMRPPSPGRDFTIRLFRQIYAGTTGNHMDNKIYLYGMHESATVRLMRFLLESQRAAGISPVYVDIGCNAGMHLTAVADLADQAYGFEPWEKVRRKAQNNIEVNSLAHARIFDFGLADVDETLPFTMPDKDNLGVGFFSQDGTGGNTSLKVRRGDDVFAEHKIAPTLIKIDVEGFEKKVLKGLEKTIRQHRPAVIFEYNDVSRRDLGDLKILHELFGPDYSFHGIRRSREFPALEPFNAAKKYENIYACPA